MYSNCTLHCSWLEGQCPKILCAQENKKEDNSSTPPAENAFQGCTNSVCEFSLHLVNSKWNLRSSNQILGEQHDLQIVHLCCRQTDLANAVPWKTLSFQPPRSYKVPKGTLSSAAAGLLLIIIATITIIVIVIAVERDSANACNIWALPGGI